MPLRAIDFHVHLPTPDWLDGSMASIAARVLRL
jgi:hypothetical protein